MAKVQKSNQSSDISDKYTGLYGTQICIANFSKISSHFFHFQAQLEKQLLDVKPISSLPEVPKTDLPKSKTKPKKVKEEDEMAELAAWAS